MNFTYSIVKKELEAANGINALMSAANLIQFVASITDRERLGAIVKRRMTEFKAK